MAPGLSYDDLKALGPCTDSMKRVAKLMGGARKWNGRKVTAEQARAAGATFDDLIWAASAVARTDKDVERRLRLWVSDCAAHVLHIYERATTDDRPRDAIVAARRYARGEISAAAMDAAMDAGAAAWAAAWATAMDAGAAAWATAMDAGDAARDAARAAARAAWAAGDAARAAARAAWAARDAAWATAMDAGDAARAAAMDAAWATRAAEQSWQFDRLIMWLSDAEPDDWPLPERSTHAEYADHA